VSLVTSRLKSQSCTNLGYSVKEIGKVLGIKKSLIYKILH
jgi:hypothetical protein